MKCELSSRRSTFHRCHYRWLSSNGEEKRTKGRPEEGSTQQKYVSHWELTSVPDSCACPRSGDTHTCNQFWREKFTRKQMASRLCCPFPPPPLNKCVSRDWFFPRPRGENVSHSPKAMGGHYPTVENDRLPNEKQGSKYWKVETTFFFMSARFNGTPNRQQRVFFVFYHRSSSLFFISNFLSIFQFLFRHTFSWASTLEKSSPNMDKITSKSICIMFV